MMERILVVDVGTSSLKAMLYESSGKLLLRASQEYHSEVFHNNQVEQKPSSWQEALLHTFKEIACYIQVKSIDIEAISITSQRASVIPVDESGKPLYQAIMWQDKRSVAQCSHLLQKLSLSDMYRRTGLRLDPYFSAPKMMWIKDNESAIFAKTYKFLGVQDYVVYLLTHNFVTDWSQACRTMLMNISNFCWDSDMLEQTGLSADLLPELVPPGTIVGQLTTQMAEATGLKAGIPVIIGGGDQQCAALALNILRPGYAEANTGTGSFVVAYSETPQFDQECRTLCSAAAIPGKWIAEAGIFNTGSIHRWFKENFYDAGDNAYELMNREAERSPVGANGVILLPHFEGSAAPYWNPMAKGMFFNLSLATRRSDFTRAILEGIALEIRHNLSLIEKLTGTISLVSVAGGLTTMGLFNQIQADAFAKTVIRYDNNEASSLGALMSAGVTLKMYPDYHKAFQTVTNTETIVYKPDATNVEKYTKLFVKKNSLYNSLNQDGIYELMRDAL